MTEPSRSQVTRIGDIVVSRRKRWLRNERTHSMAISRGNHRYLFARALLGGSRSGTPVGGRTSIGGVVRAVNRVRG